MAAAWIGWVLAAAQPALVEVRPGIYTNEEEVSFADEAGRAPPAWIGVRVQVANGRASLVRIDRFGKAISGGNEIAIASAAPDRLRLRLPGGTETETRLARPFSCWMSALKDARGADGKEQWTFDRFTLHDQGGRALAGKDSAPGAVFRLRNVTWPAGSRNKPSLVLYVHRPDGPDRAVSYSWADPAARLIGINLRWVQGSCSLEEGS